MVFKIAGFLFLNFFLFMECLRSKKLKNALMYTTSLPPREQLCNGHCSNKHPPRDMRLGISFGIMD